MEYQLSERCQRDEVVGRARREKLRAVQARTNQTGWRLGRKEVAPLATRSALLPLRNAGALRH
jgi:hypothetical protein